MSFSEWIIDYTVGRTMLYLICSTRPSVDLARYDLSRAKDLGIGEMCTITLRVSQMKQKTLDEFANSVDTITLVGCCA